MTNKDPLTAHRRFLAARRTMELTAGLLIVEEIEAGRDPSRILDALIPRDALSLVALSKVSRRRKTPVLKTLRERASQQKTLEGCVTPTTPKFCQHTAAGS